MMNGYEFIDQLFKNGLIKRKQYEWIQYVWVYLNNEVVYKVVCQFDYRTLKKAKNMVLLVNGKLYQEIRMKN